MSEKTISRKTQKILYLCAIGIFVILMVLLSYFVGQPLLKFASEPEKFRQWIASYGIWSRVVYVGLIVLQVLIAIMPGEPFEIAGGYIFGVWEGTLLCLLAEAIGSIIVFSVVKKFGQGIIEVFFKKEDIEKMEFLKKPEKLKTLAFVLFCIPGTPKDLIAYMMGLTAIDIKSLFWINLLARIPSVISSTYAGSALEQRNYLKTAIIFGVTMVISLAGLYIYNKFINKKNETAA